MKRITIVILLLFVGGGGLFVATRTDPNHPFARRADILHIQLYPWPEGPSINYATDLARGVGGFKLDLILDRIPDPLPRPGLFKTLCRGGRELLFQLADGRTVDYGHCRKPAALMRLEEAMIRIHSTESQRILKDRVRRTK
jgi:hypothetical protein